MSNQIAYYKFEKFKNTRFNELTGKIITKFEINEKGDILEIITKSGMRFKLDGSGGFAKIEAYLENDLDELNLVVGKTIISAEEIGEDYVDGALAFFYNINTIDGFVQIRFIGEDDAYYASEVEISRTKNLEETLNHIDEGNKLIKEIEEDLRMITNEIL